MTPITNTFALPARARRVVEIGSEEQLRSMLPFAPDDPVLIVGAGSNLLMMADWPGTVLHSAITDLVIHTDGTVVAGSGIVMDSLIALTCGRGLSGLENLSGIPGEVGASAVQNVGAYGAEAADTVEGADAIDLLTGESTHFTREECGFGYRDSVFKHPPLKGRYFITRVYYRLTPDGAPRLGYPAVKTALADIASPGPEDVRRAVMAIRDAKLPSPEQVPSAGSFFKNPVVSADVFARVCALHPDSPPHGYAEPDGRIKLSAAWLIDRCGWKGYDDGRVGVWPLQPLVITNPRRLASARDIVSLEERIIESVGSRYGITLTPEVEHIYPPL